MRLKTLLPLAKANVIADEALRLGRAEAMHPLTVVVLDGGGHIVVLKREDGSGIMRGDIAAGKAWGALGMGIPSRSIRDRLADRPSFQTALAVASDGRLIPVAGGVLINNGNGETIGAVGVSGDASDKDEYCAIQAITKAGYTPNPDEPALAWQDARL
jgi:uncharacterized protein GlcG (DUF336 family)